MLLLFILSTIRFIENSLENYFELLPQHEKIIYQFLCVCFKRKRNKAEVMEGTSFLNFFIFQRHLFETPVTPVVPDVFGRFPHLSLRLPSSPFECLRPRHRGVKTPRQDTSSRHLVKTPRQDTSSRHLVKTPRQDTS